MKRISRTSPSKGIFQVRGGDPIYRSFFMCFLLIPLIACTASVTTAQYHHIVHIKDTSSMLQKEKSVRDMSIQVYFATGDTLALGYFGARRGNETELVSTDMPLNVWTDRAAGKKGAALGKANVSYRWIIYSLSTSADTSAALLFTHLAADILQRTATDKAYRPVLSVDTVLSLPAGDSLPFGQALDGAVNLLYDFSISMTDKTFRERNPLSNKYVLPDVLYTDKSLDSLSMSLIQYKQKILTDTVYTKGIYTAFTEFLENAPSVTGAFWVQPDTITGNGYVKLYKMGSDSSSTELKEAWGICFGGHEIYKLESGRLLAIEKDGNGFALSRYLDYRARKNQALAWRMAIGSYYPDDNNPYERKRSIPLSRFKGAPLKEKIRPTATKIDMTTGELSF